MNTSDLKNQLRDLRTRAHRYEDLHAKHPDSLEIELKYVKADLAAERLEGTILRTENANLKIKISSTKPPTPDYFDRIFGDSLKQRKG